MAEVIHVFVLETLPSVGGRSGIYFESITTSWWQKWEGFILEALPPFHQLVAEVGFVLEALPLFHQLVAEVGFVLEALPPVGGRSGICMEVYYQGEKKWGILEAPSRGI